MHIIPLRRVVSQWLNLGRRTKFMTHLFVGLSIVGLGSILSVLGDAVYEQAIAPIIPVAPTLSVGLVANAQASDISAEDINKYAEAVLKIEPIRTATLDSIEALLSPNPVPAIACNQETSVTDLPSDVQPLVVDFCQTSIAMVEETGLSVAKFNQITASQAQDSELFDAIQAALIRLQTPNPNPPDTNNPDTNNSDENGTGEIESSSEES